MNNWEQLKRRRLQARRRRKALADQLLPVLRAICQQAKIEMGSTGHGWQFRKGEYIVNWHPASNKVRIQYCLSGHGQTVAFKGQVSEKSRVIQALEELIAITQPNR